MSISTATRSALLTEQSKYAARLVIAETAYEKALAQPESYKFDSGEGSQQTKAIDIEKLRNQIVFLEKKIDAIARRLDGTGLIGLRLSRYGGAGG